MKLGGNKKIILLGIILLIVAGVIVVALKGFNVSLFFQQHESINLSIGKEIQLNDVNTICKEVFKDKKFVLRKVELFNDSVNIRIETITNEEKDELIKKMNEKYQVELTVDSLNINTNSNIRIRDFARPYIKPVIATVIVTLCYLYLRFRKVGGLKLLGKILGIIILTEATLASIIAIIRLPLSPLVVNIMIVIGLIELLVFINKKENEYKTV